MFAPRQVTTHRTLGQGEVHGCVVTVLVTASVKHCHLWFYIALNVKVFAELVGIKTFRV